MDSAASASMTRNNLAEGVYAVALHEDLVLLDVRADAYFCLPDSGCDISIDSVGRQLAGDDDAIGSLRDAGLVTSKPTRRLDAIVQPARPNRSALPVETPLPTWRDIPELLACVVDVFLTYRGRAFGDLVRRMRSGTPRSHAPDVSAALLAAVAGFQRWAPYAPLSGKCLLRSYMLLRLLQRRGLDAYWVFGVRTWPFAAHCWLQCGDLVLDDCVERIAAYAPILVI
jgi:hypothetical protein